MRTIMIINAKGGSGKSTIATNLASYYASQGKKVVLADHDPQECSLDWLSIRPKNRPLIRGIAAYKDGLKAGRNTDYMIIDAPAAVHGNQLTQFAKKADVFLIPVLPSPVDMRAAVRYIQELKAAAPNTYKPSRVGIIANRARGYTNIFLELDDFLSNLRGVSYLSALRESQNYIQAAERGIGIFEMGSAATAVDREEWQPILSWLEQHNAIK